MTGRKTNISAWRLTALAAIVLAGCLLLTVGMAFARYREEAAGETGIRIKKPAQVYLWSGSDPEAEYVPGAAVWTEREGNQEMMFLVTNTDDSDEIPAYSQEFRLRLIGSLDMWSEDTQAVLRLTYNQGEQAETVIATARPISKDTKLYAEYGEGWLFTFENNNEQELTWKLDGKKRSTMVMQLVLENSALEDPGLLTVQVLGDMVQD